MAKSVYVSRDHGLESSEALGRLKNLTTDLETRYGIKIQLSESGAQVSGKGVKGEARISAQSVTIDLSLKLPASLFAGKIKSSIERYMDENFSA